MTLMIALMNCQCVLKILRGIMRVILKDHEGLSRNLEAFLSDHECDAHSTHDAHAFGRSAPKAVKQRSSRGARPSGCKAARGLGPLIAIFYHRRGPEPPSTLIIPLSRDADFGHFRAHRGALSSTSGLAVCPGALVEAPLTFFRDSTPLGSIPTSFAYVACGRVFLERRWNSAPFGAIVAAFV